MAHEASALARAYFHQDDAMRLISNTKARSTFAAVLLVGGAITAGVWAISSMSSCDRGSLVSRYNAVRGDWYPLDDIGRSVNPNDAGDAGLSCPEVTLETFDGDAVRFSPAVRVVAPFAERLRRFETTVIDVAQRHYGRPPRAIVNDGAYLCRPVRHRSYRLSEHALGNAIDVVGFDFDPVERKPRPDAGLDAGTDAGVALPPELRGKFRVRIEKHWRAQTGQAAMLHARFLEDLTRELGDREIFRSVLGPSHPTHRTHFHLDMAPWPHFLP
jgi:hypothetical protein